jgi:hypothetical protein
MSIASTQPLSATDRFLLHKLKGKAWFTLLRFYVPLFLLLAAVYFEMRPHNGVSNFRGRSIHIKKEEFDTVFPIFAAAFAAIFLGFLIKDFRRLVLPFLREEKLDKKLCRSFLAKKYHDPLYDKRLLFYPDKEDYYIEVCAEDFDTIGNGDELYLEVASITGEVLVLKSPGRVFKNPEEFSFSDR